MMRGFFAAVLSVIAAGVMLIAYGLISPRMPGVSAYQSARPMLASERVGLVEDGYIPDPARAQYPAYASDAGIRTARAYPVNAVRQVPVYETAPVERRVVRSERATRATSTRIERAPGRDWTRTAMVIGGSSAAGAGLGAIFGGKKGALIGAAIGGGAGTLYEVRKR
jgi:hypothetical protein